MKNSFYHWFHFALFIAGIFLCFSRADAQHISGMPLKDAVLLHSQLEHYNAALVELRSMDTIPDPGKAKALRLEIADTISAMLTLLNYYSLQTINNYNAFKNLNINYFINTYVRDKIKINESLFEHAEQIHTANLHIEEAADAQAGGVNATAALDALGTFIAERFKEELTIEYLERFRDTVSKIPEFNAFFPSTLNIITKNDPFLYNSFLTSMQSAVKDDLNKLPEHLINYADVNFDRLPAFLKNDTTKYFLAFVEICHDIFNGTPVNTAINAIGNSKLFQSTNNSDPLHNYILLASLLSRTLTDKEGAWLKGTDISAACADPQTFQLFIGLAMMMEEKNAYANGTTNLFKTITFNNSTLEQILNSNAQNLKGLAIYWEKAASAITGINAKFQEIKTSKGTGTAEDDTRAIIAGMAYMMEVLPEIIPSSNVIRDYFNQAFPVNEFKLISDKVNSINSIYLHTIKKEYALALSKLVLLLDDNSKNNAFINCISKYGIFLTTLAEADTKDEMYEAIKTAALPVGSFRIKRMSASNIALNAFAGGFYGWDLQQDSASTNYFGFTAPVGIAFSRSFGPQKNGTIPEDGRTYFSCHSISLFISIIDIGAITAFRITNDSTETLPSITWNNFIAPGAYLIWGIRKSPVSISAGAQYGPQVKKLDDLNNDAFAKWNFRLGCTVDIPLLNFNTKPYGTK